MRAEDFWREYVGNRSVQEFLGPEPPESIEGLHAKVWRHVTQLPSLYGLTLRGGSWKKTAVGYGFNREQVADGITCYIESRSAEWEKTTTPFRSARPATVAAEAASAGTSDARP